MRRLGSVDLRLLRIFTTVVDCNGFSNAQVALGLSQSTLSTHMASLEAVLGSKLCQRGRRGFKLTRSGEETYRAAIELFRSIDAFQGRMARVHGRETERLRVGVIDAVVTATEFSIPNAVAAFARENEGVMLDLATLPQEQLERSVAEGRCDVAIGPMSRSLVKLEYVELASEGHRLYCARGHPWFDRPDEEITQADFAEVRFSVRAYRYFDDVYRLGRARVGASVSSMEAQEIMILLGAYVGFLPEHRGAEWTRRGAMRAVRPSVWSDRSTFSVAYDAFSARRVTKRAFVSCLLATAVASSPLKNSG